MSLKVSSGEINGKLKSFCAGSLKGSHDIVQDTFNTSQCWFDWARSESCSLYTLVLVYQHKTGYRPLPLYPSHLANLLYTSFFCKVFQIASHCIILGCDVVYWYRIVSYCKMSTYGSTQLNVIDPWFLNKWPYMWEECLPRYKLNKWVLRQIPFNLSHPTSNMRIDSLRSIMSYLCLPNVKCEN